MQEVGEARVGKKSFFSSGRGSCGASPGGDPRPSRDVDLLISKIAARLNGIGNECLRIPQPGFDPCGREPAAGVIQVGANVSARAANGVARLALILDFIELLAKRGHCRSELLCRSEEHTSELQSQ